MEKTEKRASTFGEAGWRHQPAGVDLFALRGSGDEVVHLYAPRETGEELQAALQSAREDVPRLIAEVVRLGALVEELRARPAPEPMPSRTTVRAELPVPDDEPLSLAAPFRVGPREARAAKDDPLVALAVQVAKALAEDAREIERARLIAMAFAATRGDLLGFWAARRQRGSTPATKPDARAAKPGARAHRG